MKNCCRVCVVVEFKHHESARIEQRGKFAKVFHFCLFLQVLRANERSDHSIIVCGDFFVFLRIKI